MFVKYLNFIDNEKIPVRLTKYAFSMFSDTLNRIDNNNEIPEIMKLSLLLMYGIEAGCNMINENNKWDTLEKCSAILDYDNNIEDFNSIIVYFSGKDVKDNNVDNVDNVDKKKVVKKK